MGVVSYVKFLHRFPLYNFNKKKSIAQPPSSVFFDFFFSSPPPLPMKRASQLGLFVSMRDCRCDSPLHRKFPTPHQEGESIRVICEYQRLSLRLAPTLPTPPLNPIPLQYVKKLEKERWNAGCNCRGGTSWDDHSGRIG